MLFFLHIIHAKSMHQRAEIYTESCAYIVRPIMVSQFTLDKLKFIQLKKLQPPVKNPAWT